MVKNQQTDYLWREEFEARVGAKSRVWAVVCIEIPTTIGHSLEGQSPCCPSLLGMMSAGLLGMMSEGVGSELLRYMQLLGHREDILCGLERGVDHVT